MNVSLWVCVPIIRNVPKRNKNIRYRKEKNMVHSYVSIDLETTGLNPKRDKIIEIGAVKIVNNKICDTFSTFVNPNRMLDKKIIELTGITDEHLAKAPGIEEIIEGFMEFLGDFPLLGHSILFDYAFLKKAAINKKMAFEKEAIDTLKIARKYLNELEHKNLDYLCKYYEIPHQAHRALEDAMATSRLYVKLAEEFYQEEDTVFQPQKLFFSVKKDTPITKPQKERLYNLIEKHKLNVDYELDKLTRSEASRYTDKILAKYGR